MQTKDGLPFGTASSKRLTREPTRKSGVRALGERGLIAMERLMGMLRVMVAVQMLMNGIATFMRHNVA